MDPDASKEREFAFFGLIAFAVRTSVVVEVA
jgi:hypothetical protein